MSTGAKGAQRHLIQTFRVRAKLSAALPGGSDGKAFACNGGGPSLIPGSEDPLEKEMETHSSILALRIPWRKEPGRLQSMGSQRVGHD